MTAVLTTVGATLMAQSFAANTSVPVTSVRVGSLAPAMRYDATPSPTGTRLQGLLDHTPRILALPNITLLSNMGVVQIDISDEDLTAVYDADEIAFMSGATPVFLVAQASGPYYRKVANASALFSLNFEIAGMAATSLTVSVPSFVFATQAQALARTAANVMMSPLRVADAMGRTIVLPRELPTGANLNLFDNADHYGFWYRNSPTGIQNLPAGITAGQLNLEVMQNGPVSPGVSRVTQRLTVSTADDVRLFVRDSYDGEDLFNEWREMGKPVDHQVFTANGTWTKPAGVKTDSVVKVQMWGGGGSGCTGSGSNSSGAGGGYSEFQFLASDLPATVPVTVGASHPGTTGNGSVSNVGNDSTFGTYQHARGGGRRSNVRRLSARNVG